MASAPQDQPAAATDFLVASILRRCNDGGIPAYLVRRGDAERGTVLVKVDRLDGTVDVFTPIRDVDGAATWLQAGNGSMPAPDALAYVDRSLARDPDLWVVEIEDRLGRNPFA